MIRMLLAGAAAIGVAMTAIPAQAQVSLDFGIGRPAYGPPRAYERPVERRVYRDRRVVEDDDEEECRIVVRRRVNAYGEVVIRRTRVCD